MTFNLFDLFTILSVGVSMFLLAEGYLGNFIKNLAKFLFSSSVFEYFVFVVLLLIVFLFFFTETVYAMGP